MDAKDWTSIASASIVAIGWFVNGYLNRMKDVAQKRLEYRLTALEAFLQAWFIIQKNKEPFTQPGCLTKLEDARAGFQLYGFNDEIYLMEQFIAAIQEKNLSKANESLNFLVPLVRSRIRKELNINDNNLFK